MNPTVNSTVSKNKNETNNPIAYEQQIDNDIKPKLFQIKLVVSYIITEKNAILNYFINRRLIEITNLQL